MSNRPLIDIDWTRFSPWRVQGVSHNLTDHPLLQLPTLLEFGERQEKCGRVRTHGNDATAATPFNAAPHMHPNCKSATATLSDLENAGAWTSLLNIQTDEVYRSLVDQVLDSVQGPIEKYDPGMSYRAGWIFVASPRTVTPFHIDTEHGFLLQVQGRKRVYVWDPDDVTAVSEAARDLFHATHSRDLIVWRDALRERAHVFDLEPGMGAYVPSTSPHLVENGGNASVTVSFTYYTAATRRDSLLHTLNYYLRQRGFSPSPVGYNRMRDAIVFHAGHLLMDCRALLRTIRGRSSRRPHGRYAEHRMS